MEVASNRNCLINWNNWSCFPLGTETMKWIEIRKEICISSWFCKQWACFIPTKILEKSTHQKLKKGNVLKVVAIISLCRIDWSLFILSLESNTFYKTTKQQLANNSLWTKCGLPSVFVWPAKQECLEQFLNDWKKIKRTLFYGMWKLHRCQCSVSINKVLLEHSHKHLFVCIWLLPQENGRVK